jgi:hypothetical protein
MQHLSMLDSNFPMCALPCLAYTTSMIHYHQELA